MMSEVAFPRSIPRLALLALLPALLFMSSCSRVALDERFHGDRLVNWTMVDDPDLVEGPGEWRAENGWLRQTSNAWGLRGDFLGRWYGTFLVAGNENWGDYKLTLTALPEDDDGFGVAFRYRDGEHFYRLLFLQDGLNGGPLTRLDKREGAEYTELWSERRGYKVGEPMRIEITARGNRLSAAVDGHRLFDLEDASYRRGRIALFCYAQSQQSFDDVKLVLD